MFVKVIGKPAYSFSYNVIIFQVRPLAAVEKFINVKDEKIFSSIDSITNEYMCPYGPIECNKGENSINRLCIPTHNCDTVNGQDNIKCNTARKKCWFIAGAATLVILTKCNY